MLVTVAAAGSAKVQKKKYSVFIYSEAEPHAMYAIYKQTHTLCVLYVIWFSGFPYYMVSEQVPLILKCPDKDQDEELLVTPQYSILNLWAAL